MPRFIEDLNDVLSKNYIETGLKKYKYITSYNIEVRNKRNCWFRKTKEYLINIYLNEEEYMMIKLSGQEDFIDFLKYELENFEIQHVILTINGKII